MEGGQARRKGPGGSRALEGARGQGRLGAKGGLGGTEGFREFFLATRLSPRG